MTLLGTSAVEVGVDITNMHLAVEPRMPVDRMSFLQRIGRVGRKPGCPGLVVVGRPEFPAVTCLMKIRGISACTKSSYASSTERAPIALRAQLKC